MTAARRPPDLAPACRRTGQVIASLADHELALPTPCPESNVGDLIEHVRAVAARLTAAATARRDEADGGSRSATAHRPTEELGSAIVEDLMSLAAAWREPEAWQGSAMIRGTSTPARVLGLVVLDEMVVHGWDIAVAAGRIYEVTDAEIEALIPFVSRTSAKRDGSLFGPVVEVPPGASPLDRLLGLAGRDPSWKPAPR